CSPRPCSARSPRSGVGRGRRASLLLAMIDDFGDATVRIPDDLTPDDRLLDVLEPHPERVERLDEVRRVDVDLRSRHMDVRRSYVDLDVGRSVVDLHL